MKKVSKKLMALTLAVIMMFATCMTAFADDATGTYTATFYKDGSTTDTSMANKAVAGKATVTESDGAYTVTIPLKAVSYGLFQGYITKMTVTTSGQTYDATTAPYDEGSISINLASISGKIDISFEVVVYMGSIRIGTPHEAVSAAPEEINADLYLTK